MPRPRLRGPRDNPSDFSCGDVHAVRVFLAHQGNVHIDWKKKFVRTFCPDRSSSKTADELSSLLFDYATRLGLDRSAEPVAPELPSGAITEHPRLTLSDASLLLVDGSFDGALADGGLAPNDGRAPDGWVSPMSMTLGGVSPTMSLLGSLLPSPQLQPEAPLTVTAPVQQHLPAPRPAAQSLGLPPLQPHRAGEGVAAASDGTGASLWGATPLPAATGASLPDSAIQSEPAVKHIDMTDERICRGARLLEAVAARKDMVISYHAGHDHAHGFLAASSSRTKAHPTAMFDVGTPLHNCVMGNDDSFQPTNRFEHSSYPTLRSINPSVVPKTFAVYDEYVAVRGPVTLILDKIRKASSGKMTYEESALWQWCSNMPLYVYWVKAVIQEGEWLISVVHYTGGPNTFEPDEPSSSLSTAVSSLAPAPSSAASSSRDKCAPARLNVAAGAAAAPAAPAAPLCDDEKAKEERLYRAATIATRSSQVCSIKRLLAEGVDDEGLAASLAEELARATEALKEALAARAD